MKKIWLLLLLSVFFSSCTFVKPIKVSDVESVKLKKISLSHIDMLVSLPIENPNIFSFTVTELNLAIKINDIYIGDIQEASQKVIKAKSKQIVSFPVRVEIRNVLTGALGLVSAFGNSHVNVNITGNVKAKSWLFKKKIDVNTNSKVRVNK